MSCSSCPVIIGLHFTLPLRLRSIFSSTANSRSRVAKFDLFSSRSIRPKQNIASVELNRVRPQATINISPSSYIYRLLRGWRANLTTRLFLHATLLFAPENQYLEKFLRATWRLTKPILSFLVLLFFY